MDLEAIMCMTKSEGWGTKVLNIQLFSKLSLHLNLQRLNKIEKNSTKEDPKSKKSMFWSAIKVSTECITTQGSNIDLSTRQRKSSYLYEDAFTNILRHRQISCINCNSIVSERQKKIQDGFLWARIVNILPMP